MVRTQLALTAFNNAPIVQAYQHVSSLDYLIHEFGHRSLLIFSFLVFLFIIHLKEKVTPKSVFFLSSTIKSLC